MDHPIKRPSYAEHIKELFTPKDVVCMKSAVDLASYEGVRASAAKISEWIGSGRMPPPSEGRSWSSEKLQTFRNWATNTGYAEKPFVRLIPSNRPRVRRRMHDLSDQEVALLKKAFAGIMARDTDQDNPTSFFNLAGLHWLPGPVENTFCRHHDDAYNPWHRAYLMAFEDGLRTVDGCENVTLPYWDILGEPLPDWIYEEPFYPYRFAHRLESLNGHDVYEAGQKIVRNPAAVIVEEVKAAKENIEIKIGEALVASTWRGFNGWSDWPNRHEGIIRAHDNGHGVCGPTIANQDVAAFDPLFWFFHCNWDRLWWKWQTSTNTRSLLAFKSVVSGDQHWLSETPESLLAPFDVNAAEMIDLSDWNVDYEQPKAESFDIDNLIASSGGHVSAAETFGIPTTEQCSVRVKDINRLDIPGSFNIVLYSGENVIAKTRIFQPSSPRDCANCSKHGVFSADFIVARNAIETRESLRVAIKVETASGKVEDFPLEGAGSPTVNVRLLLSETPVLNPN